ncbi:hypothetical protein ILUMI_02846 [Ignelater luminosus]|uniref:Uncharacterized protein n=1 Tax=Ignelater luminosus TaxID=2038154 RepID=A0A8K0DC17_IGNLU|nr:hypothetical protein ILUMI_02846 [Ignelater luminosus]
MGTCEALYCTQLIAQKCYDQQKDVFVIALYDQTRGIKISGVPINKIRYVDDTAILADNIEDTKELINLDILGVEPNDSGTDRYYGNRYIEVFPASLIGQTQEFPERYISPTVEVISTYLLLLTILYDVTKKLFQKVNLDVLIEKDQTVSRKMGPEQAIHGNAKRKRHTQNEGHSMHSCIERETNRLLRSGPIYLPCQWIPIIRLAKKNGKPYSVQEPDTSDVYDLKQLSEDLGNNSGCEREGPMK